MLWVVTFSVFLPSLTSSSVVWVHPGAAQKPRSIAQSQMFFISVDPILHGHERHPVLEGSFRAAKLSTPRRAGPFGPAAEAGSGRTRPTDSVISQRALRPQNVVLNPICSMRG